MDTTQIRGDLSSLKTKLNLLENQLENQMEDLEQKEEKWKKIDEEVQEYLKNQSNLVRINVGGKKFVTRLETLVGIKDTFFYKVVVSKKFNLEEEIFFDRNPKIFPIILDYLRNKYIDYSELSVNQIHDLKIEADYFDLTEISENIEELMKSISYVKFYSSGLYTYNNQSAGTNRVEDLLDRSLTKGICANTPGWITIELNNEWEFKEINIGGYNGNTNIWSPANGNSATIYTSKDNSTWTNVGTLPSNYGAEIINVKLKNSTAKYIKFQCNSYLGIGFLEIIKKIS